MTVYVVGSSNGLPILVRQFSGSSDTLVIGDAQNRVESTGGSAASETVPTNASVTFPTGTLVTICQTGTGQVAVIGASGVTIHSPGGLYHTRVQYSTLALLYEGSNVWTLTGDLV